MNVCPDCGAVQSEIASSIAIEQESEKLKRYGRYGELAPRKKAEVSIDNHLIEYAQTSWQVQNVAATSVTEVAVNFKVAEPTLTLPSPTTGLLVSIFAIGAILAMATGGAAVWLIYAALLIWSVFAYRSSVTKWEAAKQEVERRHKCWVTLKENPFHVFGVSLHTNAGIETLFYSLDKQEMESVSGAIKDSMSRKNESSRLLSVTILDVSLTARTAVTLKDAVDQLAAAIGIRFIDECSKRPQSSSSK